MKALLFSLVLICASVPARAGDIPTPPRPQPPPCTENCAQQAVSSLLPLPIKTELLLILLGIIR